MGALAFGLATAAGCSLIGTLDAEQCQSAADCAAIGEGLVCQQNLCVTVDNIGGGGGAGGIGHEGGGGGAAPVMCSSNLDCYEVYADEIPHVCNLETNRCGQLRDNDACSVLRGDYFEEKTVTFAVLAPLDPTSPAGHQAALTTQWAVKQINGEDGLPGPAGSADTRMVAVVCDQHHEQLDTSLARLVNDVGVHAFIVEGEPAQVRQLVGDQLRDQLVIAVQANDDSMHGANFDDGGLLWHLVGDISDLVATYQAVLAQTETEVRARYGIAAQDPIKVMVLKSQESDMSQLYADAESSLVFNGMDATMNGSDYEVFDMPSPEGDPDYAPAREAVLAFDPHIIIGMAGSAFLTEIVDDIEATWDDMNPRPFYIASPRARNSEGVVISAQVLRFANRFVGVEFTTDPTLFAEYDQSLRAEFGLTFDNWTLGYNLLYDAIYMLAYAAYGAGQVAAYTPAAFLTGLDRLDDAGGPPIAVGIDVPNAFAWDEAIQRLSTSSAPDGINFHGTSGQLAWGVEGSRNTGSGTYCLVESMDANGVTVNYAFGQQAYEGGGLVGPTCFQ